MTHDAGPMLATQHAEELWMGIVSAQLEYAKYVDSLKVRMLPHVFLITVMCGVSGGWGMLGCLAPTSFLAAALPGPAYMLPMMLDLATAVADVGFGTRTSAHTMIQDCM